MSNSANSSRESDQDSPHPAGAGRQVWWPIADVPRHHGHRDVHEPGSCGGRRVRWYAFADGQQDLFDADASLPDFLEVQHELRENFRNSRSIARFAAGFGDVELDCVTGDGLPVWFVAVPGEHVVSRTCEVARKLQRDERIADADLALLWLFHNPNKGASDRLARTAMSDGRVESNSGSFKGMERPVVVLGLDIDIDPTKHHRADEVRRAIYAAATRARSMLIVVGDPAAATAMGLDALAAQLDGSPRGRAGTPRRGHRARGV